MVSLATNSCPQRASFESELSALFQATNSKNTQSHLFSKKLMNIKRITVDAQTQMNWFSLKTYIVESTIGINRKIQVPAFFLLDTGAGSNLISNSIVQLSWQSCNQLVWVPRLQTAVTKSVRAQRIHATAHPYRRFEATSTVWRYKRAFRLHTSRDRLHKALCAGKPSFFTWSPVKKLRSVYLSAMGRRRKESANHSSQMTWWLWRSH